MKNMGLSELVVVAPRTRVGAIGARMAAHARDVLEARRTVPDLASAVAECTLVVGTTCRAGGYRAAVRGLAEVADEILSVARAHPVALVFGPEDHGLDNADLRLCQRIVRIPTSDAYPSLNLAQAVLLCGYELWLATIAPRSRARGRGQARPEVRGSRRGAASTAGSTPATSEQRQAMMTHLAQALERIGFLSRDNPEHILHDVRGLFARAALTERDVRVWRGIARQILWASANAPVARKARVRSRERGARA